MNSVSLVGILGADPRVVVDKDNLNIAFISIATKEREKKDGEWITVTDWNTVKIINRKNLLPYLKKGASISVIGKLKNDKFTDQHGVTKYSNYVLAQEIELLSVKKSDDKQQQQQQQQQQQENNTPPDDWDDDIPMY